LNGLLFVVWTTISVFALLTDGIPDDAAVGINALKLYVCEIIPAPWTGASCIVSFIALIHNISALADEILSPVNVDPVQTREAIWGVSLAIFPGKVSDAYRGTVNDPVIVLNPPLLGSAL